MCAAGHLAEAPILMSWMSCATQEIFNKYSARERKIF